MSFVKLFALLKKFANKIVAWNYAEIHNFRCIRLFAPSYNSNAVLIIFAIFISTNHFKFPLMMTFHKMISLNDDCEFNSWFLSLILRIFVFHSRFVFSLFCVNYAIYISFFNDTLFEHPTNSSNEPFKNRLNIIKLKTKFVFIAVAFFIRWSRCLNFLRPF